MTRLQSDRFQECGMVPRDPFEGFQRIFSIAATGRERYVCACTVLALALGRGEADAGFYPHAHKRDGGLGSLGRNRARLNRS